MFNYEAIRKAFYEPNVDDLDRFVDVYSASRALANWPSGHPENTSSTFRMLKAAAEGEWDKVFGQVAYYTDVQDAARLLIAVVALPSLGNERIFAYCHNSTWNELRYKIRLTSLKGEKLVKGKDRAVEGRDLSNAGALIKRAEDILREIGQQGFASEEDILRGFLDSL
ncbi:aldehyde reductase II [Fusarium sp. NRRL 25303]|nr:aldehyde reductase II [Fusarium sp. NRRL 25303]